MPHSAGLPQAGHVSAIAPSFASIITLVPLRCSRPTGRSFVSNHSLCVGAWIVLTSRFDVGSEVSETGNPAAQTVTASGGVAPLVVLGAYGARGFIDPRTFTVGGSPAKDGEVHNEPGGFSNIVFAWKIYNASPADVVVDMDDEIEANYLQSFYIEMAI
ncbi:MAG TPA: hypothetical protein VET25_00545 [Aestuariivirgaceae bacterium]|nr:hypothetical protein [Aestuariivirgaceae bacterium]